MNIWNFFKKPSAEMQKVQEKLEQATLNNQIALLELQEKELQLKKIQVERAIGEEDSKTSDDYDFV